MDGFFLLFPFLLIRFVLLSKLNHEGLSRAAHFAPMYGNEKLAYYVYQISTTALLITLCFRQVSYRELFLVFIGFILYLLGLCLCTWTIIDFAKPSSLGLNERGIYQYSRNPMYVSYFFIFIGASFLTQSWILLFFTCLLQVSGHWIIRAEERWCLQMFQDSYVTYRNKVRRYI